LLAGGAPMPVVAARTRGKGRTLALTFDTSWYWNFRAVRQGSGNRAYLRFWQNAVRWLAHDPSSKFLGLGFASDVLQPGSVQGVRVRALRSDYTPLKGGRVH